jgi:hypothetical protein
MLGESGFKFVPLRVSMGRAKTVARRLDYECRLRITRG